MGFHTLAVKFSRDPFEGAGRHNDATVVLLSRVVTVDHSASIG